MTLRAFLLGLLGVAVVCGYTYFNDGVLRQTMFVCNHMPTSVYGGLVLFLLLLNPLLGLLWRKTGQSLRLLRPFSARELALVLALVLPACCIPYSSMLRILPRVCMLPHHYVKTQVHWRWRAPDGTDHTVLEYAPKQMLADVSKDENQRLTGYTQGLRNGRESISFSQVPWGAWTRTLLFWLPLFGILWVTCSGMALAVHPQWARHEHLPYPIVQFTEALLPAKGGETSPVFRDLLFWIAFIGVLAVHTNNFFCVYYPDRLIEIRRSFNFWPLARLFPTFMKGGGWSLISPRFYFAAIGLAYLLATDVSLSVGLGPFIFKYVGGILAVRGIPMGGGTAFTPRIDKSLVFGGYFGMFMATLYTGRHYFLTLGKRMFGGKVNDRLDTYAIWGGRVFLAGFTVFVLDLWMLGLDWQLALLYAFLTIVIFLIMGRIIAETGLFFIAPYLYPCTLLLGFMGEQALGPRVLMIMFLLTCVVLIDPRETFMPYMVNVLQLTERSHLKVGKTTGLVGFAMLFGLAIATSVTLYFNYDRGVNWNDGFATKSVPRYAGDGAMKARQRLLAQDMLEESQTVSGWARFANMKPDKRSTIAFFVALLGVILCSAGRLRFAKWPLHPVLFLVWSGYAGYMMAWSFLIGCFLKFVVSRYGGAQAYQRVKPLMFGLIAGDMVAGLAVIVMGFIYNQVTGELPRTYWVLPG
jgi:hypothetical protein